MKPQKNKEKPIVFDLTNPDLQSFHNYIETKIAEEDNFFQLMNDFIVKNSLNITPDQINSLQEKLKKNEIQNLIVEIYDLHLYCRSELNKQKNRGSITLNNTISSANELFKILLQGIANKETIEHINNSLSEKIIAAKSQLEHRDNFTKKIISSLNKIRNLITTAINFFLPGRFNVFASPFNLSTTRGKMLDDILHNLPEVKKGVFEYKFEPEIIFGSLDIDKECRHTFSDDKDIIDTFIDMEHRQANFFIETTNIIELQLDEKFTPEADIDQLQNKWTKEEIQAVIISYPMDYENLLLDKFFEKNIANGKDITSIQIDHKKIKAYKSDDKIKIDIETTYISTNYLGEKTKMGTSISTFDFIVPDDELQNPYYKLEEIKLQGFSQDIINKLTSTAANIPNRRPR